MRTRLRRIARLRDLTGRQEKTARLTMARAEMAVRQAKETKANALGRTQELVRQELPGQLRSELLRVSIRLAERQDIVIGELTTQFESDTSHWLEQRQRAGSINKLYERIERQEQLAAGRRSERELGDMVASRITADRLEEQA